MSLLYECINGIIQGGILEGMDAVREGEEVASLCVEKLRGMTASDGDPNCQYERSYKNVGSDVLTASYSKVCSAASIQHCRHRRSSHAPIPIQRISA